jgi:hypothetical protein
LGDWKDSMVFFTNGSSNVRNSDLTPEVLQVMRSFLGIYLTLEFPGGNTKEGFEVTGQVALISKTGL